MRIKTFFLALPPALKHNSPHRRSGPSPDTPLPPSTSEFQGEPITISFPSNIQSLGFPNIGNTCYMNATLQALLGLSSFTSDLLMHRHCWESHSSALLLRNMGDLQVVRQNTTQTYKKRQMLKNIRRSISTICPEFSGDHQQDAHEFLVFCLIKLKEERASISYLQLTCRCPVANMEFQLLSVYTCNSTSCEELQDSVKQPEISLQAAPGLPTPLLPGHYICDVLEGDGSNWLCFNDDMVSRENTDILEESCLHHWAADCLSSLHQHRAATCSRFSCFNHGASTCLTCPNNRAATCLTCLNRTATCLTCLNHGDSTCLTCLSNRAATCSRFSCLTTELPPASAASSCSFPTPQMKIHTLERAVVADRTDIVWLQQRLEVKTL
ncbi:hypothetical protein ACEWY4_001586 [Coilia grayii]|uniref:USP domain-containing protein n=1 Tax=Coilia grayii TaxID=363190 RepID=A0ABD1KTB2_9TELE